MKIEDEYVSKQAVLNKIFKFRVTRRISITDVTSSDSLADLWREVKGLPSVTLQEPKTGYWIENAPEWQNIDPPYICSECGLMHLTKTNYCDQCGAKMIELQKSEDKEKQGNADEKQK